MDFVIFPSLNARCEIVSEIVVEQLSALEQLRTSTVGSLFPFLFLLPYLLTLPIS